MGGRYKDRADAGRRLAEALKESVGGHDVLVLALPRGGVPVGAEVARALGAELDIYLVRKLGVPQQPELAFGAVASGGTVVLNHDVVGAFRLSQSNIEEVALMEAKELMRRERLYRGDKPPPRVAGRTVILVDDGLATGASMRAAARAVRQLRPRRLVIAVPVGAPETCEALRRECDDVVCPLQPAAFEAVGLWYDSFDQTTDAAVRKLLGAASG
jgi:putative phosphoribosyl transferase